MIAPAKLDLNAARFGDAKSRSPFGGSAFTLANTIPSLRETGGDLNAAGVDSHRMLADLNHIGIAPKLAAAVAGINRAIGDEKVAAADASGNDTRREELTRQAQKLVSQTFFGPMLKQMRNSPFKSELFDGGRGGQMFHSMMDQHLADRMSRGSGNKLVRSIVQHLEKLSGQKPGAINSRNLAETTATAKPASDFANVRIHVAPSFGN